MLAIKQLRSVGAARAVQPMLPLRVGVPARPRFTGSSQSQDAYVRKAYNGGGNNEYDNAEVQQKLDELQGKLNKWWDEIEDKGTFFLYVGVSVFGLTIANQFLRAVDAIPLFPNFLKLVGLVYSSWFTYKYLLFADGRAQLDKDFKQLKDGIAGSVKKSSNSSKVDKDLQSAVSSLKAKAADTTSDLNSTLRK